MPSRHLLSLPLSPPSPEHRPHSRHHHHLPAILAGASAFVLLSLLLFLFVLLYRKLSRHRTAPTSSDLKSPTHIQTTNQCRRFSYSLLRRATASFSPSNRLGHGGFGCVYKAVLSAAAAEGGGGGHSSLAVKVMDPSGSLQGEREFHNELSIGSSLDSPYIVSLLGYSTDRRKRKLVLVYELMENRSLQEALMDRKCEELMDWSKRYSVMTDIARGLEYLHHFCNPPVIHGDVKPSNILLDSDFNAKIGDFGLARLKTEEIAECAAGEDNGSILEEVESVAVYEDSSAAAVGVDQSPVSFSSKVLDSDASPEAAAGKSVSEADRASMESGRDLGNGGGKKGGSRRDWWWKQDNGVESESGRVKDYVMEWIGSEISKESRSKPGWNLASPSSIDNNNNSLLTTQSLKIEKKKKIRKRLEWWASLDEERLKKKEKSRKPREWWKEEFCDELTKKNGKKKKKRGLNLSNGGGESWWQKDEDSSSPSTTAKKKRKSRGSIDWWMDGSQDWASGEIPKSGGISSTPSMRGTVCYIAPEYGGGGGGQLSEKCDVYSFGVLLLVVVSGRRPLQVTASPMSEFERANLISWARQLAHNGKLLDLVDPLIHSLDKHQALLVITIALLCLQRSPSKRPSVKEIVEMLSGEAEPPHLPFEFSPSPPSNFPFKSRKKAR
ncbi:Receptor-like serine/threonine-protein kinase At2g45590 [Linum perenne]